MVQQSERVLCLVMKGRRGGWENCRESIRKGNQTKTPDSIYDTITYRAYTLNAQSHFWRRMRAPSTGMLDTRPYEAENIQYVYTLRAQMLSCYGSHINGLPISIIAYLHIGASVTAKSWDVCLYAILGASHSALRFTSTKYFRRISHVSLHACQMGGMGTALLVKCHKNSRINQNARQIERW